MYLAIFFPLFFFKKIYSATIIDCLEMPVTMCDCSRHTWLSRKQRCNYKSWYVIWWKRCEMVWSRLTGRTYFKISWLTKACLRSWYWTQARRVRWCQLSKIRGLEGDREEGAWCRMSAPDWGSRAAEALGKTHRCERRAARRAGEPQWAEARAPESKAFSFKADFGMIFSKTNCYYSLQFVRYFSYTT